MIRILLWRRGSCSSSPCPKILWRKQKPTLLSFKRFQWLGNQNVVHMLSTFHCFLSCFLLLALLALALPVALLRLDQAKRELAESQKASLTQSLVESGKNKSVLWLTASLNCFPFRHRDLADSSAASQVQSEQKQQASQLNEQLRERQRELIKEQELRSKAEEMTERRSVCEEKKQTQTWLSNCKSETKKTQRSNDCIQNTHELVWKKCGKLWRCGYGCGMVVAWLWLWLSLPGWCCCCFCCCRCCYSRCIFVVPAFIVSCCIIFCCSFVFFTCHSLRPQGESTWISPSWSSSECSSDRDRADHQSPCLDKAYAYGSGKCR